MSTDSVIDLKQVVSSVISQLVLSRELFTALDVSNLVKQKMNVKHRQVRDVVREIWDDRDLLVSYGRTLISVTLADDSVVKAMLYHPYESSWDLDKLYDQQKRSQKVVDVKTDDPQVTNLQMWQKLFDTAQDMFTK